MGALTTPRFYSIVLSALDRLGGKFPKGMTAKSFKSKLGVEFGEKELRGLGVWGRLDELGQGDAKITAAQVEDWVKVPEVKEGLGRELTTEELTQFIKEDYLVSSHTQSLIDQVGDPIRASQLVRDREAGKHLNLVHTDIINQVDNVIAAKASATDFYKTSSGGSTKFKDSARSFQGNPNYKESIYQLPGLEFTDPHYPQITNNLGWGRKSDFVDEGHRVIEEVQSPLHQEGSKFGYDNPADHGMRISEWEKINENIKVLDKAGLSENHPNMVRLLEERQEWSSHLERPLPNAPFKKTWPELFMKRELVKAAHDPSIKQFSWVAGDTVVEAEGVAGHAIEGALRNRYNKHLPKQMKAFLRKWGVEPKLVDSGDQFKAIKIVRGPDTPAIDKLFDFAVVDAEGKIVSRTSTMADAKARALELQKGKKIWTFPITDAMRKDLINEGAAISIRGLVPIAATTGAAAFLTTEAFAQVAPPGAPTPPIPGRPEPPAFEAEKPTAETIAEAVRLEEAATVALGKIVPGVTSPEEINTLIAARDEARARIDRVKAFIADADKQEGAALAQGAFELLTKADVIPDVKSIGSIASVKDFIAYTEAAFINARATTDTLEMETKIRSIMNSTDVSAYDHLANFLKSTLMTAFATAGVVAAPIVMATPEGVKQLAAPLAEQSMRMAGIGLGTFTSPMAALVGMNIESERQAQAIRAGKQIGVDNGKIVMAGAAPAWESISKKGSFGKFWTDYSEFVTGEPVEETYGQWGALGYSLFTAVFADPALPILMKGAFARFGVLGKGPKVEALIQDTTVKLWNSPAIKALYGNQDLVESTVRQVFALPKKQQQGFMRGMRKTAGLSKRSLQKLSELPEHKPFLPNILDDGRPIYTVPRDEFISLFDDPASGSLLTDRMVAEEAGTKTVKGITEFYMAKYGITIPIKYVKGKSTFIETTSKAVKGGKREVTGIVFTKGPKLSATGVRHEVEHIRDIIIKREIGGAEGQVGPHFARFGDDDFGAKMAHRMEVKGMAEELTFTGKNKKGIIPQ